MLVAANIGVRSCYFLSASSRNLLSRLSSVRITVESLELDTASPG